MDPSFLFHSRVHVYILFAILLVLHQVNLLLWFDS